MTVDNTKYNIIVVHSSKAFEAERLKGDAIVFINFWSDNVAEWILIELQSEQQRDSLLKIMNNEAEKSYQYALGFKHGQKNEKFGGNIQIKG